MAEVFSLVKYSTLPRWIPAILWFSNHWYLTGTGATVERGATSTLQGSTLNSLSGYKPVDMSTFWSWIVLDSKEKHVSNSVRGGNVRNFAVQTKSLLAKFNFSLADIRILPDFCSDIPISQFLEGKGHHMLLGQIHSFVKWHPRSSVKGETPSGDRWDE